MFRSSLHVKEPDEGILPWTRVHGWRRLGHRSDCGLTQRELGIFLALDEVWAIAIGIAIGTPLLLGGRRLIDSTLFGISASDPLTVAAAAVLLLMVAAIAAFLPALRVSRVDPVIALRHE
jgi:putative ABC transport system permease protein